MPRARKKKGEPSEIESALMFHLDALKIPYVREVRFHPPRLFRADFIITRGDGARLMVELQGGAYSGGAHGRGKQMQSDGEKSALAAIDGYFLMTPTGEQARSGAAAGWIQEWRAGGEVNAKAPPGAANS